MHTRFTHLLAVLLFAAAGCTTKHIRLYDGEPRASSEVALLNVQWKLGNPSARIQTLDGRNVEKGRVLYAKNIKQAELLPGPHTLEISYFHGGAESVSNLFLTFTAHAGRVYDLRVAPIDEGFGRSVAVAAGGYGHWTGWIADAQTKEVLAGVPRTNDLRWYE